MKQIFSVDFSVKLLHCYIQKQPRRVVPESICSQSFGKIKKKTSLEKFALVMTAVILPSVYLSTSFFNDIWNHLRC